MEVKKLYDAESVYNDIIIMKNGMYRFIINNQLLLINCVTIFVMPHASAFSSEEK